MLFAVTCTACSFTPDGIPPPNLALDAVCSSDAQCASGACGRASVCVECRIAATCGDGRTCDFDSGRCVDVVMPPTGGQRHVRAAGAESRSATRVHVGRVAVVPVSSSEVR